jgi:hypothetical protein
MFSVSIVSGQTPYRKHSNQAHWTMGDYRLDYGLFNTQIFPYILLNNSLSCLPSNKVNIALFFSLRSFVEKGATKEITKYSDNSKQKSTPSLIFDR